MFILQTVFLPFYLIYYILWYMYRSLFIIQFSMNFTCESFFGEGYGCNVLNPTYIFTTVIYNTLVLTIIVYLGIKLYELYCTIK